MINHDSQRCEQCILNILSFHSFFLKQDVRFYEDSVYFCFLARSNSSILLFFMLIMALFFLFCLHYIVQILWVTSTSLMIYVWCKGTEYIVQAIQTESEIRDFLFFLLIKFLNQLMIYWKFCFSFNVSKNNLKSYFSIPLLQYFLGRIILF